jgi:DNA-binding IclR family transcriptional regulator
MSAPVFDAAGTVVFSLMILGQSYDLDPDEIEALTRHLVDAARDATARLDGRWP